MDIGYTKIVVTIILAVVGWLMGHYFTARRDVVNKRRELSIEHLIKAYRVLANDISHREQTSETNLKLENILDDIQLFGSLEQIAFAEQLADEVARGGVYELSPLIESLRDDLRRQLNLPSAARRVRWLRFKGAVV